MLDIDTSFLFVLLLLYSALSVYMTTHIIKEEE